MVAPLETEARGIGAHRGQIAPRWADDGVLCAALVDLPAALRAGAGETVYRSHTRVVRLALETSRGPLGVAVKIVPAASPLRRRLVRLRASAAARSYRAALELRARGLDTPEPVAWIETQSGDAAGASFYVSRFDDRPACSDALSDLYDATERWDEFAALAVAVARGVRALHDAGVRHGDLGNQNALVGRREDDGGWGRVGFLDLSRSRFGGALSARARGADASRLALPYALAQTCWTAMYDGPPPRAFVFWEALHRFRFALHTVTRKLRHPVRELVLRHRPTSRHAYPGLADVWFWDEASARPVRALRPVEAVLVKPWGELLRRQGAILRDFGALRRAYVRLGAEGADETVGEAPVAEVRVGPWMRADALEAALARLRTGSREGGGAVCVLVPGRRAVRGLDDWSAFCRDLAARLPGRDTVWRIGEALNDVAWGVRSVRELEGLLRSAFDALEGRSVGLGLGGPDTAGCLAVLRAAARVGRPAHLHLALPVAARGQARASRRWLRAAAMLVWGEAAPRCTLAHRAGPRLAEPWRAPPSSATEGVP